jgi:hypothetical protein
VSGEKTQERHRSTFNAPIIHKEYQDLGNERNIFKVRLLQYQNVHYDKPTPLKLDIRQFLLNHKNHDNTIYTGFTQRGISLGWDDLQILMKILPDVLDLMDEMAHMEKK